MQGLDLAPDFIVMPFLVSCPLMIAPASSIEKEKINYADGKTDNYCRTDDYSVAYIMVSRSQNQFR